MHGVGRCGDPAAPAARFCRFPEAAAQQLLDTLEGALAADSRDATRQSAQVRVTLDRLVRVGGLALAAAAAFLLLLTVGVGHSITGARARLHRATEAVADGTADRLAEPMAEDEVGGLDRTINRLAGDLRKATAARTLADDVIATVPDALLVTDAKLTITRANPAALRLLGATDSQQVLGRRLTEGARSRLPRPGRPRPLPGRAPARRSPRPGAARRPREKRVPGDDEP